MLAAALLLPALAVYFSLRQPAMYRASAKVLLKEGDLAATLSGIQDNSFYVDPNRVAQTQIQLAETPAVAARVLRNAHVTNRSPAGLLGSLGISAEPNADILNFTITDRDPAVATLLTNEYARQYTVFRSEIDTASLSAALKDILRRIKQLRRSGQSALATDLVNKAEQLRTLQAVKSSNAVVAEPADGAVKVQPTPVRYGVIGLALGIVLGIGLAFLRDALDTRIRSAEEISQRLGLPLLARIPEPPRKLQRADDLVMLKKPRSVEAEAFRVLRTNLDFVNLERHASSIMITSALEEEGKSTTIANLAVAAARAGRRVVLVDLDLRRPYLARFFKLENQSGLTDVVLGHATLEQATTRVAIVDTEGNGGSKEGNGRVSLEGFLDVLPSGPVPPDPGEFVGTMAVSRLLNELSQRYDLVLVDAPPILHAGDALTLAAKVSAILIIARLPQVRRPIVKELKRVLESCPSPALGFALAGAHLEEGYGYDYYGYSYASAQPRSKSEGTREGVA